MNTYGESDIVPDFEDGVPEVDEEPEDAGVDHEEPLEGEA